MGNIIRVTWKCPHCQDVQISKSNERHNMQVCKCKKSGLDLEEYYSRGFGKIDILKTEEFKNNKWVIMEEPLKKIYLAISYSGMEESSFEQANLAAATLMNKGKYNVFSPITHSHILATNHQMPGTWSFWEKIDMQFIDWADEVWVLVPKEGMKKINQSIGVQAELDYAIKTRKKIRFIQQVGNELQNYQTNLLDYV